jgi:HD superfamily phosphohydrolase
MNSYKIFNDPLYGFITVPKGILLDLIDHPYMQRLHRIRQLGLSYLVYPGALHTRLHHALGALHLVQQAIEVLRKKNVSIDDDEALGVQIAVLLHDMGHGPFSHSLEGILIPDMPHESLTLMIMHALNKEFRGQLSTAISIFENRHPKKFLHNLVSGQLDMDRLDYLNRDSFYTGVSEGVISSERIIKMLHVNNEQLVVEEKGIYSLEKFLIARRLMYWQVYLHKTVLAAEQLLINIFRRAREVYQEARLASLTTHSLCDFLQQPAPERNHEELLKRFCSLDDSDVIASIKQWMNSSDETLRTLCSMLINRNLYKIKLSNVPIEKSELEAARKKAAGLIKNEKLIHYFAFDGSVTNSAYNNEEKILILFKDGSVRDIASASDLPNISIMSTVVRKYFLCQARLPA